MKSYQFKGLLNGGEWIMPAFVRLDLDGNVLSISKDREPNILYTAIEGFALRGIPNTHSHAFQYAMVGLTELHDVSGIRDDFWGWRNAMYQLALSIDPDQMEAIATMLYKEMLRHGYTTVAEFHYVHRDKKGQTYDNVAELGTRLIAAAKKAGIKITLVPIFYQKGGFGQAAGNDQKRFISKDIDEYEKLLLSSKNAIKNYNGALLGCGVHSLRAVEPEVVKEYCENYLQDIPFHIHVSEQLKEISQAIDYLGQRPVAWMINNIELSDQFNFVHATHLNEDEVVGLAKSEVSVVLCPSTEGNLGDGLFPVKTFQNNGGKWSIGTDSHIGLNPFEELRILDYGQRVHSHQRNIFNDSVEGNSGNFALRQVISNGRKGVGLRRDAILKKGDAFDVLVMDGNVPILNVCSKEHLSSTIVYATDVSMHLGTMVDGQWVIHDGKHIDDDKIEQRFIQALKLLKNR